MQVDRNQLRLSNVLVITSCSYDTGTSYHPNMGHPLRVQLPTNANPVMERFPNALVHEVSKLLDVNARPPPNYVQRSVLHTRTVSRLMN
jgi:hypothetical protein